MVADVTEVETHYATPTSFQPHPPPMTLPDLESHLAKAADLLRGAVDQADFKAYIFPLMFFKRISDVYLEEHEQALAESDGDHEFASFAENHRFAIPPPRSTRRWRSSLASTAPSAATRALSRPRPRSRTMRRRTPSAWPTAWCPSCGRRSARIRGCPGMRPTTGG